jgi:hypothetical protein
MQATAAVESNKRASAAWNLLRLNSSAQKANRLLNSSINRTGSLIAAYTTPVQERINDNAPGDELEEEAEDALAHLAKDTGGGLGPHGRGDGYRISTLLFNAQAATFLGWFGVVRVLWLPAYVLVCSNCDFGSAYFSLNSSLARAACGS